MTGQRRKASDQTLQVQLLGGVRAQQGGHPCRLPAGRPVALLVALLIDPAVAHSRERLMAALWPDSAPSRAGRYLSNALHQLHRVLGRGWCEADAHTIQVKPEALDVDLWHFRRLAASAEPSAWEAALGLCAGALAPEVYDDWIVEPRRQTEAQGLALLDRLVGDAVQGRRWSQAAELLHRRLSLDPADEPSARALMTALTNLGRVEAALRVYDDLARFLEHELAAIPEEQTTALAHRLQTERRSRAPAVARPFVGRARELAQLLHWLEHVPDRGHLAVVTGESGIGKSRLLAELAAAARMRGWAIHIGRATEFELPGPYAPLDGALRAALPAPRWRQLERTVSPSWLTPLGRWLFERASGPQPLASVPTPDLGSALAQVLQALGRLQPHLFVLEDVQWGDAAIWPLLSAIQSALAASPVAIVLSARSDDPTLGQVNPDIAAWQAQGHPVVPLNGLDRQAVQQLVSGLDVPPDLALDRLVTASGGNPLLALEMIQTPDAAALIARQPDLSRTLLQRVQIVSDTAQRALAAAAVLGFAVDDRSWSQVLDADGLSATEQLTAQAALERARLIEIGPTGYQFPHDTLRACVYHSLEAAERRRWHRLALTVVRDDPAVSVLIKLGHAEQAGEPATIRNLALEAGEQALAALNPKAAIGHFQRLIAQVGATPLESFRTQAGLARCYDILNQREDQRQAVAELQRLALDLGQDALSADVAWHTAHLQWATGDFAGALAAARAGAPAAERSGDLARQALLLEWQGRAARDLGDLEQARMAFEGARQRYAALHDPRGQSWIEGMLGMIAQRQGRFAESEAHHLRAIKGLQASADPYAQMRAESALAILHFHTGDYQQARTVFERILVASRASGDLRMEEAGLHNLGALADILGDYEAALDLKRQAIDRSRAAGNRMGVAVGSSNLGITQYKLGHLEQARASFDEALGLNLAMGRQPGQAYDLQGLGQVLPPQGHLSQARDALNLACQLRRALGERHLLADALVDLALVSLADEDAVNAQQHADEALMLLRPEDAADLRASVHYVQYRVAVQVGSPNPPADYHLALADEAQSIFLSRAPREARPRLLRHDPRQRATFQAVNAASRHLTVQLPPAQGGRRARPVNVHWTLRRPADDLISDPIARRRQVLGRLLAEAEAQGGRPTDALLAQALGVSRRTLIADRAALAQPAARHAAGDRD